MLLTQFIRSSLTQLKCKGLTSLLTNVVKTSVLVTSVITSAWLLIV
ncbi:hypothetical protein CY0110_18367 [Crocosphaera chwakensis CCY0110]|uniref:Uncharacterized protein n=1 Tax=Crocosphaera chwakensis CCY0110 TaxID=391612 RepID=A3IJ05_9CHRO|nr:hypothetical protein CY0110_18367 [Crocosphaera chwakensis CCY0110]